MRSSLLFLLACLTLVMLAAGEADAKEPLWNTTVYDHVESVVISVDGEYIAAGGHNGRVYLFYKDSSTPLWTHETNGSVQSVAISADGEYITAGSRDNVVYLFHKDSSTPLWSYETGDRVYSVAISADGDYIAAGSENNKVYLFDKDSSTPLWSYATGGWVYSVAISADGEYIAVGSKDEKVYLFDKDSSTPLWSYTTGGKVGAVAISAAGEYIAAGSEDYNVYLFDKDSSTPLWSYAAGHYVWSVAISADGGYVVAGSWDEKVYLFNKDSGTPLWNYNTTRRAVFSVAISADGEYIAVGSEDDNVYLFDKNSSTPLWNYENEDRVVSVAISADGEYIVAGSDDFKVYLFSNNILPTALIDSISPSLARFDAEVTFSGSGSDSDGTVVAHEWTSGIDGFLSDEEDFSITGFSVGTHTISFRVQDNDGDWSEWDTAELVIYPNALPVGTIDSIEPSPAEKGTAVFFSGTGSDTDGTVVTYLWSSSFDGNLSTEANFSSSDLSLGHHTIAFWVQDNNGDWSDAASESLFVFAYPVAIAGEDLTTEVNKLIQFSGTGTDKDGSIVKYEWDFDGDGSYDLSSGDNGRTTNVYNKEGTYTAVLRITDNDGFTGTDSRIITVSKAGDDGDGDDGGGGMPALSVIITMAAVAVMALRRRPE